MSEKTQYENNTAKRDAKKRKYLAYSLIAVLLIGIGLGSVLLFNSGVFSSNAQMMVTFDSTGGSEIESQTVSKGGALIEVGSPTRSGYVFAGWYYEEAPINAYNADDVFTEDTTLYAGWYQPEMESDIEEYIKDSDSNITFVVHSDVALTDENLSDYISCDCADNDEECTLSVKPQDDGYLLYSEDGFSPGLTYSIKLLDTKTVYFMKAGEEDVPNSEIRAYNFTVYRENVNKVVMKADPKLLSSNDVADFKAAGEVAEGETGNENDDGKTIYRATLVKDDGDYQVGDIISLGSGEKDAPENQYYKVMKVTNDDTGQYLDLIAPNLDDIYSKLEVYYSGDAVYFEDEEENEETRAAEKELQTSIKESEGYDYLCTAIAMGIKESPTLRDTVATLSMNNQKRFEQLSISTLTDLLKNVEVKISIQKTYDITNKENGVRGTIYFSTGDIDIKLDENIKLTLNLTLNNELTETAYGYSVVNNNWKVNINQGALLSNHCNLNFSAVIGTSSGEKKINITEEIQNLINSSSDDKTQSIVDSLNEENFFGDDLEYVEIFSKELGNKTVAIYEVLTIQFKLNFHVDIGMRVGLNLNFDSTEVRRVGLCNMQELTGTSGMVQVNQRLSSHTHFTAILKGQIGIRAGFKAEVNFSIIHLNDVVNFGFSVDVGVYEELSGFVRFDYDSSTGMSMAGGLKSETGIYLELDFTWNLCGWESGVTIAELKFPILTIGSLEFASEFETNNNAITFDTMSYNIKNSSDSQLKLKYIDISGGANGVTINIKPASLSEDYKFYTIKDQTGKGSANDLKYVAVDPETGMISIADNAPERLDFTVVVQYTKGCSLFSQNNELITKGINFTYLKYKANITDSNKKYKATFYSMNNSVIEQKEYYVGQIPVPPADDTYEDLFVFTQYKLKDWAKPWKEDFKAIYSDADYHLDCELNYKNISFYGDVYNQTTREYQYGLIAAVPTLYGEMPVPPTVADAEPGWVFESWSPELMQVQTDYSYTAAYSQDSDYCFYNFYVDNNRISYGFVKIGDTPPAPDMSQYNTEDQKFMGWWPSLGSTTDDYQIYNAVFRRYVNVTFKDQDGKVLSQQRIVAGETPEAPKVDDVVEGEEDYYEEHFSHWATEDGTKLGKVYSDTVYQPVYDTQYLEVTTIFDAGTHTFTDGSSRKEYTGTYAPYNFLYMPQVTYRDNESTFNVDYWISTEKVNGSYVKLYMSKIHTDYKYNLTFTPVYKTGDPVEYTVRFSGGDQDLYFTGNYGDLITVDMLSGLTKTSQINNYEYKLTDYGLALPYRFGTTLGSNGLPETYVVAKVSFTLVGVDKTFTFDANGGGFADDTTVKTVTAPYATHCSFNEVPVKADDSQYTYEFVGWSDNNDATSGSSFSDFVINGNSTFYAVYTRALRNYTVTFDAGDGHFTGGGSTVAQVYHYGDTIVPPGNPTRDEDDTYRYVFMGWQPALSADTLVTMSCTYTATYRAIRVDGTYDQTGIIVSDGVDYEDICVNYIPGYTYTLVGTDPPTLTVTGNGLTFSGISDEVCVIIASGVTDVTFNDLTLSGEYSGGDILVAANTNTRVTIQIAGTCVLNNTQSGGEGARFDRSVQLIGTGLGANLTISANGSYSVYCADDFDVDSLELEINSTGNAIANDEESGEEWLFADSVIRLNSGGIACGTAHGIKLDDSSLTVVGESGVYCADMVVSGVSAVDVTVNGEHATAIGTQGDLIFADFIGTFSASSTHLTSPGIAVRARADGIIFKESGAVVGPGGYDLGGTEIGNFDSDTYSSFQVIGTLEPAASVTVTKP